jgi:hypothetical protein
MENTFYPVRRCFADHRPRVILCIAGVDNDRLAGFLREGELLSERTALLESRRIVIVVVETAFADRDGTTRDEIAKCAGIMKWIEPARIVRMNPRGMPDESAIRFGDRLRCASGAEDILGAAA